MRALLEDGEVVDLAKDRQAGPRVRLRPHHGYAGRCVVLARPGSQGAVTACEGKRQELLRPRRQGDEERCGLNPPRGHTVGPDVRPQHRTRWRHFRLKHMYNPRRRAVYQVSASRAERIAQGGKRVTSCATHRKVEIANALISLRTSLTLPRCSRV